MSFSFPVAWVYLLQGACLTLIALVCWFLRPDLRRWQLTVGLALMPLGPAGELYFLQDYWHAPFVLPFTVAGRPLGGIGDLVFGLAMGSIAAIGAAVVSGRTLVAGAEQLPIPPTGPAPSLRRSSVWERAGIVLALLLVVGGGTYVLFTFLHLPSTIANSITLLVAAMILYIYRRDLWWYVLLSAAVSAATLVAVDAVVSFLDPTYLVHYWFPFGSSSWLSLLILGRVPLTEGIFAVAFGAAVGPLYPTLVNRVLVKRHAPPHPHTRPAAAAATASPATSTSRADVITAEPSTPVKRT